MRGRWRISTVPLLPAADVRGGAALNIPQSSTGVNARAQRVATGRVAAYRTGTCRTGARTVSLIASADRRLAKGAAMPAPIIAFTMGDPAGVGPEIILKTLADPRYRPGSGGRFRPLILGDPAVMVRAAALVPGAPALRTIQRAKDAVYGAAVHGAAIDLVATAPAPEDVPWGRISLETARAMLAPLDVACDMALAGAIQGIVFGPLNKEAFHLCGHAHRDEVEYMAERTACPEAYILGLMRGVWVTAVAEHVPFLEIAGLITRQNVLRFVVSLDAVMRRPRPRSGRRV
jgi:4-hydroxy-L-threonine phosphate dehydrogenase PdxA